MRALLPAPLRSCLRQRSVRARSLRPWVGAALLVTMLVPALVTGGLDATRPAPCSGCPAESEATLEAPCFGSLLLVCCDDVAATAPDASTPSEPRSLAASFRAPNPGPRDRNAAALHAPAPERAPPALERSVVLRT